ncbi:Hypothetical Protein FCC1311_035672 [Hondaea fermentalgiana]|uniref:LRRK2 ARM repeat domain-containing protein n=1 Tax=Hondaea fermentalgiana TaxID=2315210 RepID=A0A2R5G9V0_9STRA|nr:Hypothetical Protein FCC1311_035672 [Hondaea fermentalgiana]|eukprot:GBG27345.1 Hypothetical Protein FCC1311_035672 [Hondaea fermentalgiana]
MVEIETLADDTSEHEGLLARRKRLQRRQQEIAAHIPRWLPSRSFLVQNLRDGEATILSPSGVVNLAIAAFALLSLFATFFLGSTKYGVFIAIPTGIYTAAWLLYPMVEPSDGSRRAVHVMTKHPYLRQAQLEGSETLFSLSRENSVSKRKSLIADGAMEALLDAAILHESDAAIVARALAVVGTLAKDASTATDLVDDEAVEFILHFMQTHLRRESVQKHSMTALVALLVVTNEGEGKGTADEARARALDANAVVIVCRAMDAHIKVARVQQWGSLLLSHLTDARSGGAEPLHKGGVVQQVVKTLENHATAEPIQQIGVGLLAKCLTANPENPLFRKRVAALKESNPRILELVQEAQTRFPKSPGIQDFGARILHDVALVL